VHWSRIGQPEHAPGKLTVPWVDRAPAEATGEHRAGAVGGVPEHLDGSVADAGVRGDECTGQEREHRTRRQRMPRERLDIQKPTLPNCGPTRPRHGLWPSARVAAQRSEQCEQRAASSEQRAKCPAPDVSTGELSAVRGNGSQHCTNRRRLPALADVLVAETDERAAEIAVGFRPWLYGIRTDYVAQPYPSPTEAADFPWDDEREAIVSDRLASRIVGSRIVGSLRPDAARRESHYE
jgi:hypothetical protein